MRRTRARIDAATATALSTEMRERAIQLKKTNPSDDQFNAALRASQKELIREPWGEPGRNPDKINPKSGKPRGYKLQAVLGLDGAELVYNHYHSVIKTHAVAHLELNQTYSAQGIGRITTVVLKSLNELPVFHLYDDNWPIHAFLKGILRAKANQKQSLLADIEFKGLDGANCKTTTSACPQIAEEPAGVDGNGAPAVPERPPPPPAPPLVPVAGPQDQSPPSNRTRTSVARRMPEHQQAESGSDMPGGTLPQAGTVGSFPRAAAEGVHRTIQEFGHDSDPEGDASDDGDRELTPPAVAPPLKKRGRTDPDKNIPGAQNPQAKRLNAGPKKKQASTQGANGRDINLPSTTTRKTTKKGVTNDANSEPGPGPSTMANQKRLARQKAKGAQK